MFIHQKFFTVFVDIFKVYHAASQAPLLRVRGPFQEHQGRRHSGGSMAQLVQLYAANINAGH